MSDKTISLRLKFGSDEYLHLEKPSGTRVIDLLSGNQKKSALVAKVDGKLIDLTTPILESCDVEVHTFDSAEGRETFWHSSAHVLGQALCNLYGCKLVNGPPIEEGFYYDVASSHPISTENFTDIEREMERIVKSAVPFVAEVKTKEELLDYYKDNKYKKYFIEKFVEGSTTIYWNGNFGDMCLGPHLVSTAPIKAIKLLSTSSVYFLNDSKNDSLQRIYAISFPSEKLMNEYVARVERAKEMDHRKIGRELDLFFFHRYSPGSCFWLPNGAHIYNKLMEFLRSEYRIRGFKEVITPNIFSVDLWKESGHYENYRENIYMLQSEDMAMKPMNCPGHSLIFRSAERSFRELPLRLADFGVLHRNELSGTLTGLTRVRRFQQDDAHIFCTKEQMRSEISSCIAFLRHVYGIFKFSYEMRLSTRPEKFIGKIEDWEAAEEALRQALNENGVVYDLNEGDGAFYGPKIDIVLCDAIGRKIQCATIQLDFQLPLRFGLKYTGSDGLSHTPIIIHRAILGSIERMVAILLESYGKKLPFWLTPRQIAIIPLYAREYAEKLARDLRDFEVKIYDDPSSTLNKKVRSAQLDSYRLICVVGAKEAESEEINVRIGKKNMNIAFETFKDIVSRLVANKSDVEDIEELREMAEESKSKEISQGIQQVSV